MTPQKQTRSVEEIAEDVIRGIDWPGGPSWWNREAIAAALQAYGDQVTAPFRAVNPLWYDSGEGLSTCVGCDQSMSHQNFKHAADCPWKVQP
jgi:hypothetical protein